MEGVKQIDWPSHVILLTAYETIRRRPSKYRFFIQISTHHKNACLANLTHIYRDKGRERERPREPTDMTIRSRTLSACVFFGLFLQLTMNKLRHSNKSRQFIVISSQRAGKSLFSSSSSFTFVVVRCEPSIISFCQVESTSLSWRDISFIWAY